MNSPVLIKVQGGELTIKFNQLFDQSFNDIWLIGKGESVYSGEIEI